MSGLNEQLGRMYGVYARQEIAAFLLTFDSFCFIIYFISSCLLLPVNNPSKHSLYTANLFI